MKQLRVYLMLLLVATLAFFSIAGMAQREDGPIRRWLLERRNSRQPPAEDPTSGDLVKGALSHGGVSRTYYIYTPPAKSDRPLPLVLVFHGGHANAMRMASITAMHELAREKGFIVVYPEAISTDRVWNDGRSTTMSDFDDVAFTSALINHLKNTENVDRNRIYATGASNGGVFTLRLACEMSDKIAAFAPVVANLPVDLKSKCQPERPVPILMIHGNKDNMMPWGGGEVAGNGGTVISATDTVNFWVDKNGCSPRSEVKELPDSDPNDGTRVESIRYAACRGDSEVIELLVKGGGHTWPGTSKEPRLRRSGGTSRDINASKVIWSFFQQHALSK